MGQVFADAARSKLASGILAVDTSMTLVAGSVFPDADTGNNPVGDADDWFKVVLQEDADFEVVYVRTHNNTGSPNVFSDVLRAQDGTTARAWSSDAVVGLRWLASDATQAATPVDTAQTGDLAFSLDPTRYQLPDWLPCDGSFVANANMPVSLQPYAVQSSGIDVPLSQSAMSGGPPAALTHTPFFSGDWVVCRMATTPFLYIQRKSTAPSTAYEETAFYSGMQPSAAQAYVAVRDTGGGSVDMLTFTGASGGVYYARFNSSTWSAYSVSTMFSGIACNGVVVGLDKRFYYTRTTTPFLEYIGDGGATVDSSSRVAFGGGVNVATAGIAISPNGRYMVVWSASAPYVYVFEWDGAAYQNLGSPPSGAASFIRMEIADNGVFVGKPSTGSVVYAGSVRQSTVGAMLAATVNAATVWGLTSDGHDYVTWLSNAMTRYPVDSGGIEVAQGSAFPGYSSAATLYDRISFVPGKAFAASNRSYYYCWHGEATPDGWYAPSIKNGYLKA